MMAQSANPRSPRLVFTMAADRAPKLGDTLTCPIENGSDWFELGTVESGTWRSDGTVTLAVALAPAIADVQLVHDNNEHVPFGGGA